MKTTKQILIDALEDRLNELGFGRVYELNIPCNACPIRGKCAEEHKNNLFGKVTTRDCADYVEKIWKGEIE